MKIHGYILFLSGSDDDRVVIATNERKRIVEKAISAFSVEGREQRILDAIEENEANETTKRCSNSLCSVRYGKLTKMSFLWRVFKKIFA